MAPNRRQGRGGIGLMLLAGQIMQIGVDRIPPVTLMTVIVNVVIYMKLIPALPSLHNACTSNKNVLQQKQWQRIVFSSFYHLDDLHLYYNMVSFIWKGISLEQKLKSRKFSILICLFSVLTQLVMLGLNQAFAVLFFNKQYLFTCAAGFSGVIFALKVLTTASSDNNVSVMGLPISVPSRYACWVELIVIQMLVPNASFTGHLAGIFVGLMYTLGPLKKIINGLDKICKGQPFQSRSASYRFQSASTGRSSSHGNSKQSHNMDDDEDEQLQKAIRKSLKDSGRSTSTSSTQNQQPPSYGWNLSDDPSSHDSPPPSYDSSSYPPAHEEVVDRHHGLYPDLSSERNAYKRSSAPPMTESHPQKTGLPYPPSDEGMWTSTYKSDFISPRSPIAHNLNSASMHADDDSERYPSNDDELRRARLRRFDKN